MSKKRGAPVKKTEPYRKTTMELPTRLLDFLATKEGRTAWVIAAIEEKRQKEQ